MSCKSKKCKKKPRAKAYKRHNPYVNRLYEYKAPYFGPPVLYREIRPVREAVIETIAEPIPEPDYRLRNIANEVRRIPIANLMQYMQFPTRQDTASQTTNIVSQGTQATPSQIGIGIQAIPTQRTISTQVSPIHTPSSSESGGSPTSLASSSAFGQGDRYITAERLAEIERDFGDISNVLGEEGMSLGHYHGGMIEMARELASQPYEPYTEGTSSLSSRRRISLGITPPPPQHQSFRTSRGRFMSQQEREIVPEGPP